MSIYPAYPGILTIFLVGMIAATVTGRAIIFLWIAGVVSVVVYVVLMSILYWSFIYIIPGVFVFMFGVMVGVGVHNAYREKPRTKLVAALVMMAGAIASGFLTFIGFNS